MSPSVAYVATLFAAAGLLVALHELIHYAAFRLAGAEPRIVVAPRRLGIGVEAVAPPRIILAAALAPQLLTAAAAALGAAGIIGREWVVFVIYVHGVMSVGDFYEAAVAVKTLLAGPGFSGGRRGVAGEAPHEVAETNHE